MSDGLKNYHRKVQTLKLSYGMIINSFIIFGLCYLVGVAVLTFFLNKLVYNGMMNYFKNFTFSFNNVNEAGYGAQSAVIFFWYYYRNHLLMNLYLWVFYPLILIKLRRKKEGSNYIRGAKLEDINVIGELIKGKDCYLPLGKIKLPFAEEVKNFFIGGRPGTGKTNIFNQWLEVIQERNHKAIIHDTKGDFIRKFYRPEIDLVLNPLDERGIKWTILNDATSIMDLTAIANSIIPPAPSGTAPIWYDAPRDLLYGILLYCYRNNKKSNADVWKTMNIKTSKLKKLLIYTEGAERAVKVLESADETLASIIMMLMQYCKIFEYLQHKDGNFSVRDWINSDQRNFMFVSNYADIKDTMKPFISLFIETAGRAILTLQDDIKRRIYLFLDEFGAMQRMDKIVELMTMARSKGGAIFLGIQDIGRIDSIYTPKLRESIINACGNNLIFAVEDTTTADFFSKKLGDTEYWEDVENINLSHNNKSISVNKTKRKEAIVLPSQIQALRDLTAYLKIANVGITYTEFTYKPFADKQEPFIMNSEFSLITPPPVVEDDTDVEQTTNNQQPETIKEEDTETTNENTRVNTDNLTDDVEKSEQSESSTTPVVTANKTLVT